MEAEGFLWLFCFWLSGCPLYFPVRTVLYSYFPRSTIFILMYMHFPPLVVVYFLAIYLVRGCSKIGCSVVSHCAHLICNETSMKSRRTLLTRAFIWYWQYSNVSINISDPFPSCLTASGVALLFIGIHPMNFKRRGATLKNYILQMNIKRLLKPRTT